MQNFEINQDSVLPILSVALIVDGRYDYDKFYDSVQNADITFSMKNVDTGCMAIAKAPCYIKKLEDSGCDDKYVINYEWKKRDTKQCGNFTGWFELDFGRVKSDEFTLPTGKLIVPIREDLRISILPKVRF